MSTKDFRIVYIVWYQAGGIDGRSTEPRSIALATFDEKEAEIKAKAGWCEEEVEVRAVDMHDAKNNALRKLSPLDKLALGLGTPPAKEEQTNRSPDKFNNPPRW